MGTQSLHYVSVLLYKPISIEMALPTHKFVRFVSSKSPAPAQANLLSQRCMEHLGSYRAIASGLTAEPL